MFLFSNFPQAKHLAAPAAALCSKMMKYRNWVFFTFLSISLVAAGCGSAVDSAPPETVETQQAVAEPAPPAEPAKAEPEPAKPAARPEPKPEAEPVKPEPVKAEPAKPQSKPHPVAAPVPQKKPAAASEMFVVQLAALSDGAKARELKARAALAGLPTYTDTVGSLTRVRVGPYPTREAAEAAAGRLAENGMTGQVLAK